MFEPRRVASQSGLRLRVLPVIITTAELWVSDVDLSTSDLMTGNVNVTDARRVEWLWFNYNQSPALQHDIQRAEYPSDISQSLLDQFTRTIAVIGSSGLRAFLSAEFEAWT
jgi:hypothetical protein